jgi:transcriptional regulator with XRE-family HTH domain
MTKSANPRQGGKAKDEDYKSPEAAFAARLVKVRSDRGWTQGKLAERLKQLEYPLGVPQISRIEKGKRAVSLNDAYALAFALDCSLLHLLVDPDAPSPAELATTPELPRVQVVGNVQPETQYDVRAWIVGDGPLLTQDGIQYAYQRSRREIEAQMEAVKAVKLGESSTPLASALRRAIEDHPELQEIFGELPPLRADRKEAS